MNKLQKTIERLNNKFELGSVCSLWYRREKGKWILGDDQAENIFNNKRTLIRAVKAAMKADSYDLLWYELNVRGKGSY